jgi:hypothetical protein
MRRASQTVANDAAPRLLGVDESGRESPSYVADHGLDSDDALCTGVLVLGAADFQRG